MEKIVIIGAGPAGISAALYAARGNMNPLIINKGSGALEKAEKIENYYGLGQPISGKALYETGINQAKELGIRILDAEVTGIDGFDSFEIKTTKGSIETKSIILATGGKRKSIPIPGLKEFEGKGVSYCAICDAFFYRGKEVAVLGNGDFALHEAMELSHTAAFVTIYTNGLIPNFSLEGLSEKISVNTMKIASIDGKDKVTGITVLSDLETMESKENGIRYPADGVFVAMGTAGSTEIARQMGAMLTDKGNILVNENMESTIPGMFAAGDCTGGLLQIAKAVYEGAKAGISAGEYVRKSIKE